MKILINKILKENKDFDWVKNIEPISKQSIIEKMFFLNRKGVPISGSSTIVENIFNLGLDKEQFDLLLKSLTKISETSYEQGVDYGYSEGFRESQEHVFDRGYSEGYDEGYDEGSSVMELQYGNKYEEGYNEGYEEGYEEGYNKGYEEGGEETYYKGFEEGRYYQYNLEVEDFERGESEFDQLDYDENYDENY